MRLQRVGRKHEPSFRLVLTDSKNSTKSGRFLEILGSYDPRKSVDLLKTDRIKHWLDQGIAVTGSVHNLFVNHKLISAKKVNVLPKKTVPAKAVEEVKVAAPAPTPAPEVVEEPVVVEEAPAVVEETPVVVEETTPAASDESTASQAETPAEEVVQ